MYRPRIIPVLLLQNLGLVKSVKFKKHRYIGDPINAVKIFNDLEADELAFIDINASKNNRLISLDFVKNVGEEANMPFSVGGGITKLTHIEDIIKSGAEKVIINTAAAINPQFIKDAVKEFGSSTITVCIDVKQNILKTKYVYYKNGTKRIKQIPVEYAKRMEELGVGELIIQSIDLDGTMTGYDLGLIDEISKNTTVPIIALGGVGSIHDFKKLITNTTVNGLAAGSLFVYHGPRKGILINYPNNSEKMSIFKKS